VSSNGIRLLLGKERVSPASRATKVQTLGLRDLRSLIRDNPSAIGAAAKEFKQVRFIGPNFDIRPSTASAKTNLAFRTPAVLSFHVDRGQDAEQYCILHLLPAATTWIEAKSSVVDDEAHKSIRAAITEAGTYVLARVESKSQKGKGKDQ